VSKLTATQEEFLKQLFGPCTGNLKAAAKAVTGSEDYSELMDDALLSALKRRADNEIVLSSAKATFILQRILENPEDVLFFKDVAKVASDILDRAGISRQERTSGGSTIVGLVYLPPKISLPEPPPEEVVMIEHTPLPEMLK
jgi:hypothetical protein